MRPRGLRGAMLAERAVAEQALQEAREWVRAARARLRAAQASGAAEFGGSVSPEEAEARDALREARAELRRCSVRLWWLRLRGK